MSFIQLFENSILPQMIQSGCFGEDPKVLKVKEVCEGRDEFMSSVKFVDVELQLGDITETISLFGKIENESSKQIKRENFQTDLQFFNEVFVYNEIVSLYPTSVSSLLPKFYYGSATLAKPESSVIILENLIKNGFKQTHERLFIDFEHCILAFKKLGEFHGASLQMKSKNPLEFRSKINQLFETKWLEKHKESQNYFYGETGKRGVLPLMKDSEHVGTLNSFLDRLTDVHGIIKDIFEVNEHSVLCHGDFCRNNMVFKYANSGGHPHDVKFYDLGTARFASPIVDISFFLFLNTNSDLRRRHFKSDFLKVYLEAVKKYAGSAAPTMEELWEEFQKKAVYGYLLSSFFLPIMWHNKRDPEEVDIVEKTKKNLLKGGEEVTHMLCEIVRDLLKWGCLKKDHNS